MPRIHVAAAREIGAPPETIYRLLADYRAGHPRILPPEHFLALDVEEGGVGAGTVARTVVRAGGRTQRFHLRVSEPEPGHVLQEQDTESSLVTRFTVTPVRGGRASRVEIATDLDTAPGLRGQIEARLTPLVLRGVYRKQLRRLNAIVAPAQQF